MFIRRMTGFRYNLLPFDDSLVSVKVLLHVSEKQTSFGTSTYCLP